MNEIIKETPKSNTHYWILVVISLVLLVGAVYYFINKPQVEVDNTLENLVNQSSQLVNLTTNVEVTSPEDMKAYLDSINGLANDIYNNSKDLLNNVTKVRHGGGGGSVAPVAPLY